MNSKILPIVGAVVLILSSSTLILMGSPTGMTPVTVTEDISEIISQGDDSVTPVELAEWMISEQPELMMIDLRAPEDFAQFNIAGSRNIPFVELLTQGGLSQLSKLDKNVLICGDGSLSGKSWVVLRSKGFEAYALSGGVQAWVNQILTPNDTQDQSYEGTALAAKVQALREHFLGGGVGQLDISQGTSEVTPKPGAPPVQSAKKKKKVAGGC